MGTFLTTERMSPELRARVERAVSSRDRARVHAKRAGLSATFAAEGGRNLSFARLFPVIVAALVITVGWYARRGERRAVEAARDDIKAALAERLAKLPPGSDTMIATTNSWIANAAADQPDFVAPTLKGKAPIDVLLTRPALYVHVSQASAVDAKLLDDEVLGSNKDAFLLCMKQPPASLSERDLLAKVRGTYFAGAKVEDATFNVRRLAELHTGLDAVPKLEASIRIADSEKDLEKVRHTLDDIAFADAARAASAELFMIVVDHDADARVLFVDLKSKSVLLRLHKHVDDAGTSPPAVIHRESMRGCSLAFATRSFVMGETGD
jgi:hypothetical protein